MIILNSKWVPFHAAVVFDQTLHTTSILAHFNGYLLYLHGSNFYDFLLKICSTYFFFQIMLVKNPWHVRSIQSFSCLKCPECAFITKEENSFQTHAVQNHPLSYVGYTSIFFGSLSSKSEKLSSNDKRLSSNGESSKKIYRYGNNNIIKVYRNNNTKKPSSSSNQSGILALVRKQVWWFIWLS